MLKTKNKTESEPYNFCSILMLKTKNKIES